MKRFRILSVLWQTQATIFAVALVASIYLYGKDMTLFYISLILAVASAIAAAVFLTAALRPDKEWLRTKGFISLESVADLSYPEMLEITREAYASDADENKNHIIKPDSYAAYPYCKYDVLKSGRIHYGCIVEANPSLYKKPKNLHKSFPAVVIYSVDDYFDANPESLIDIAKAYYDDKKNNELKNEFNYFSNLRLPDTITEGRAVYATTVMLYRYHLPLGAVIKNFTLAPIIADVSCVSSFVVDAKYWPNELKIKYFGIDVDKTEEDIKEEQIQSEIDFIYGGNKMRKLTLTRKRSIIECASKINVFVECPDALSTVEIGSKKCKNAGLIKNGRSITVDITDDEATIFIVSSTMDASYTIPAGTQDVSLIAAPKFNPMEGNPFTIYPQN